MDGKAKSRLNFILEGFTLLVLALMIATGLSMEFRLPPGTGGEGAELQGRVSPRALTLAGLARHEWGEIHFYLALVLIGLLALHLWLHWRWVWGIARGADPARRSMRGWAFLGASACFLALAGAPWLVPTRKARARVDVAAALTREKPDGASPLGIPINGRTTIDEIAQAAGVSQEEVAVCLGVEGGVRGGDRLGPLSHRLGVEMPELRDRLGRLMDSPEKKQAQP